MLAVNKHRDVLLASFYLDVDGVTVRRKQDGYYGRYKKHDEVIGFKQVNKGNGYYGVHIPRTRATVQLSHLILLLRGVDIPDDAVIDHLNGDTTDNSVENVRVTTQDVNCRNRKIRCDNKVGYSGISYREREGLYVIRKTVKGVRKSRSARTLEEALVHYEELRQEQLACGFTERNGK